MGGGETKRTTPNAAGGGKGGRRRLEFFAGERKGKLRLEERGTCPDKLDELGRRRGKDLSSKKRSKREIKSHARAELKKRERRRARCRRATSQEGKKGGRLSGKLVSCRRAKDKGKKGEMAKRNPWPHEKKKKRDL